MVSSTPDFAIERLSVLIADGNTHTRRLTRSLLNNIGVRTVYEVADGAAALEGIRVQNPDFMILDWELPLLDGTEVMRMVRSPDTFPKPGLPVIMLTDRAYVSRVQAAFRLGVHELLARPLSTKMLQERLIDILRKPRPMIRAGKYYVPLPRKTAELKGLLGEVAAAQPATGDEAEPDPAGEVIAPPQGPGADPGQEGHVPHSERAATPQPA